MTQSVARLKEILFDSEARRLEALAREIEAQADDVRAAEARITRRIDALDGQTQTLGAELGSRLSQVFEQAGTRDRLEKSVAQVLDGAFRDAELYRHGQLSQAMAPLLVKTIKSEIANSRDEMVEALYPITGRLVKAYVANAVKDLMADINRRLETRLPGTRTVLRIKSILTGRPLAELALAETQHLDVEELFLIRRGSGDLIGHWERADASAEPTGRDAMVSGLLSAITSFAETAFESEQESLRRLERETDCIYLRATPAYLLAARCGGTAAAPVEQIVDNELLRSLEQHGATIAGAAASGDAAAPERVRTMLPELAARLDLAIAEKQSEIAPGRSGFGPLYAMLALLLLPILGWLAWQAYGNYRIGVVRGEVRGTIAEIAELKGYPIVVAVERRGEQVVLSGLVASAEHGNGLVARLKPKLPSVEIVNELSSLPAVTQVDVEGPLSSLRTDTARRIVEVETKAKAAGAALEARLLAAAAADAARLSVERLAEMEPALLALAQTPHPGGGPSIYAKAVGDFGAIARNLPTLAAAAEKAARENGAPEAVIGALDGFVQRIDDLTSSLLRTAMGTTSERPATAAARASASVPAQLLQSVDRLAQAVVRLEEQEKRQKLEQQIMELARAKGVSPRQRLVEWSQQHAFFFGNSTDYRNEQLAEQRLDELAKLMMDAPGIVRLVGYTDERGSPARNAAVAQQRAEKVSAGLVARGVPRERLVARNRASQSDISTEVGASSPNRRVEVQVGFTDEAAPAP